jgi:hypothetical protein
LLWARIAIFRVFKQEGLYKVDIPGCKTLEGRIGFTSRHFPLNPTITQAARLSYMV